MVQAVGWIAVGLAILGFAVYLAVDRSRDEIHEVRLLALEANARTERLRIQQELTREKVCSESSDQVVACSALFERIARNLTDEQRLRLACVVLYELRDSPRPEQWARQLRCPLPASLP
jgi:hypothetical protein